MKLSASNIKKSLIFSQKKAIFIFQETETPQNRYISRNGPFYILGSNVLNVQRIRVRYFVK